MSETDRNRLVERYLGVVQSVITANPKSPSVRRDREEVEGELMLALVEAADSHIAGGYPEYGFAEWARRKLTNRLIDLDRAVSLKARRWGELPPDVLAEPDWDRQAAIDYVKSLGREEREFLLAYRKCCGNLSRTARTLGVHRNTAYSRLRTLQRKLLDSF